ncbi:helix-turn-helix domain-containing protein [Streptomyces sp. TLI_146]|uniref:AraC-like ligand-binding domain-containing protein n=1 Tax=Streptomyces sp. TLI_146 TaxID=1938858 RepID=UPI00214AEAF4|nr:helix-turn-helix domain-containing protein [Streptomyces sp. TLI_146]
MGERFDWFTETVSTDLLPVEIKTDRASDFHADIGAVDLGALTVSTLEFSPVWSRRTPAHIRRGDPEQYQLTLLQNNAMKACQLGRDSGLIVDGFIVTNTSVPLECETDRDGGPVRAIVLQIPRSELPLGAGRADRLVARRLPRTGLGAVMADFLTSLRDNGADCRSEERLALGRVALDLATAYLAEQLGALEGTSPEIRARALLERVKVFIERNLGDLDLTPQAVADHHHISLRGLYALFGDEGVAAFIRTRRLERCRADLARPELRAMPIQAIAVRWGLSNATVFGRAFRQAYGLTPGEYRRLVLGSGFARAVERSCTLRRPLPLECA